MLRVCTGWPKDCHPPLNLDTGETIRMPKRGRYVSHGMCADCKAVMDTELAERKARNNATQQARGEKE